MSDENTPTTQEVRDEVAWAGTGSWTELTDEVNAQIAARGEAFDRWLAEHDRELQAERDGLAVLLSEVWAWYGDIVRNPERETVDWDALENIRAKSHTLTLTKIGETE